jgi:conjugal transfer pilus assembly protein TraI
MATPLHQPAVTDELLGRHQPRIKLIAQSANEARVSEFERKWLAVIRRCAEWFSSIPFSPDLYREPGGAFRFTIETAFYAMRLAGGQKFGASLPSEKRRHIEPQYNYGVFLAAVCSGLDEPYRHFVIAREADQAEWNPSAHGAASTWLGGKPYRVSRRSTPFAIERMRTGMLAQMVIGPELLSGLDAQVLSEVFGAINPAQQPVGVESLVHKVVRQAIAVAVDFDRKAQQQVFEPVNYAVPSAVHVAAALQPVVTPANGATVAAPAAAPSAAPAVPAAQTAVAQTAAAATTGAPDSSAVQMPATESDGNVGQPSEAAGPVGGTAAAPSSLLEALGLTATAQAKDATPVSSAGAPGIAVQQLGLAFAPGESPAAAPGESPAAAPVDPAAMRTSIPVTRQVAPAPEIADVLKDAPNMIRELFRVLREDVASGKASVEWNDKGLVVTKRLIGAYGVASETLVEHLRKRSLLVGNQRTDITLAPRAGELILPR